MTYRHFLRGPLAAALVALLPGVLACGRDAGADAGTGAPYVVAANEIAAGEYLTVVGACNDCHTPGWEPAGDVPNADRLVGLPVGFRGPWGTSYPANLRLTATQYTADEWVTMIRSRDGLPPMPWMNLHQMTERDLKAIHAYLVWLGPKGERMPPALPPETEPTTPYIVFEPVMPGGHPAASH